MGFEAPLALLAVVLAGTPIAIHLIKQRDLPTLTLPTVALLRAAQAESRKRVRLADLLLLLLRVLALALLLACLARPYSLTSASTNSEEAVALAIVLDDSASMGARRGNGTVFEEARRRALATLDELPTGSEVTVVLAGAPSTLLVPETADLDFARAKLHELQVGGTRTDLPGALQLARRELGRANSADARLLLVSDFRAADVPEDGLPAVRGVPSEFVRIEPDSGVNVALRDVLVTPDPSDDTLIILQLTAVRTPTDAPESGASDGPALPLVVRVQQRDETLLAETAFTLEGASATGRVSVARSALGEEPVTVSVHGEADTLPSDDVRVVDLEGRARSRVGVINGAPHPSPHLDELTFLRAAFEAVGDAAQRLDVSLLDNAALETAALDDLDIVVLANVGALSAAQGARLEAFVEQGGGVLITAGDQVQPASYTAALPRCMPARLEPASHAPTGALRGESPFLTVPQPNVLRRLLLAPLEPRARALLQFADGSPALAGRTLGAGRCAVLTTSVDLDWGELALAGEFVPLVEQTLRWLLGARRPTEPPRAGEPVELAVPSNASEVLVTTPSGARVSVLPTGILQDTRQAGRYRVSVDGAPSARLSFTVQQEASESDLRGAPPVSDGSEAAAGSARHARRRSWVPTLLLLAALALLAEGLVRMNLTRPTPRAAQA